MQPRAVPTSRRHAGLRQPRRAEQQNERERPRVEYI